MPNVRERIADERLAVAIRRCGVDDRAAEFIHALDLVSNGIALRGPKRIGAQSNRGDLLAARGYRFGDQRRGAIESQASWISP
jgi:hypothetical protein